jgi:hypothetical protein
LTLNSSSHTILTDEQDVLIVFRQTLRQWRRIPWARRAVAADSYPVVEDGGFDPAGEEWRLLSGLRS